MSVKTLHLTIFTLLVQVLIRKYVHEMRICAARQNYPLTIIDTYMTVVMSHPPFAHDFTVLKIVQSNPIGRYKSTDKSTYQNRASAQFKRTFHLRPSVRKWPWLCLTLHLHRMLQYSKLFNRTHSAGTNLRTKIRTRNAQSRDSTGSMITINFTRVQWIGTWPSSIFVQKKASTKNCCANTTDYQYKTLVCLIIQLKAQKTLPNLGKGASAFPNTTKLL